VLCSGLFAESTTANCSANTYSIVVAVLCRSPNDSPPAAAVAAAAAEAAAERCRL